MRQFRLIIIYPQMNASFMRRVVAVSEAAKTSIEFFSDFVALKSKYPSLKDATMVLPKEHCLTDITTYGLQNNIRVIAWDNQNSWDGQIVANDLWHCSGDPLTGNHYQTAVGLMTRAEVANQWIGQHKWGALTAHLKLNASEAKQELKSILCQLKLNNHSTIQIWNNVLTQLLTQTSGNSHSAVDLTFDGNKLKMHVELGGINLADLCTQVRASMQMTDSIIRFEISGQTLSICCEINLGVTGAPTPAIVLVGSPISVTQSLRDLEDAG